MTMKENALNIAYSYLAGITDSDMRSCVEKELMDICQCGETSLDGQNMAGKSYEDTQRLLAVVNEKEAIRKAKGVYYTPNDVVEFITKNCVRLVYGNLAENNISRGITQELDGIPYEDFCKNKIVFDPTCGSGEFLLSTLNLKYDVWDRHSDTATEPDIKGIVSTIKGNDINEESIIIAKLRIYLMSAHRYGVEKCQGLSGVLDACFTTNDYVVDPPVWEKAYDIVVGNPPYVEDKDSGLDLPEKYGNIYANVLVNAANNLKKEGVMGFIVPLSYISTPRMGRLRERLFGLVPEQFILNYSDRPDCLFASVHQKLSILICRGGATERVVYTGNYQYWYKEERGELFSRTEVMRNPFSSKNFIPKLGNRLDVEIYRKIIGVGKGKPLEQYIEGSGYCVYLNMRAAFWIKAFRERHFGSEYKCYCFGEEGMANYFFCALNSSLFWWFWVAVSDCWHITKKEMKNFILPETGDYFRAGKLAAALERQLEETKVFVGTAQTDYEYKHKSCIPEIQEIDDYINSLYGLTEEESAYVKGFAFLYRVSGGAKK